MCAFRRPLLLAVLALLLAGPLGSPPAARAAAPWDAAAPLHDYRSSHTATTLADGRVLVASVGSSEVYDPATGAWSEPAPMVVDRNEHTATLLPGGQVLVTGAFAAFRYARPGTPNEIGRTTERYDPATGRWTQAAPMQTPRAFHTATPLRDGRVLVAGGDTFPEGGATATAELYDPAAGRWRPAGAMRAPRLGHTATLLRDGRVLVVGGDSVGGRVPETPSTAEIFDPATGAWTPVAPRVVARVGHAAALLPDGRVLVSGGGGPAGDGRWEFATATAELFDPGTGRWAPAAPLRTVHVAHTATTLPSGQVLVAGGSDAFPDDPPGPDPEVYDPASDRWAPTGPSPAGLRDAGWASPFDGQVLHHTRAALLTDGRVLLAGGGPVGRAAALYTEDEQPAWCPAETGQCLRGRFLAHWRQHGGLAINGFPLSFAFTQRLEDGREYTVQYFERVRLEQHPENPPPYDVLLGQFGRRILAGVPDAPTAPTSPAPGETFFPETGHHVRPGFLAYWQQHGGLAQFGYPLSEEFTEQLEDGREYRVQYFERARFEHHPEDAPPYDVQLGQFGRRVLAEVDARR